jgi:hypothetical protein
MTQVCGTTCYSKVIASPLGRYRADVPAVRIDEVQRARVDESMCAACNAGSMPMRSTTSSAVPRMSMASC